MKNVTLVWDMDGVLADLSNGLAKLEGYDDPVLWYIHNYEIHGDYVYPKVIEKYLDQGCFENLPPMPNHNQVKALMMQLKANGVNQRVLSSCMDYDYSDEITRQKLAWLDKMFTGMFTRSEIDIVRGSSKKIEYIQDGYILIDDYTRTQKTFIENGMGDQFIFYKNFYNMLDILREKRIILWINPKVNYLF